jgi:hypothetical protein
MFIVRTNFKSVDTKDKNYKNTLTYLANRLSCKFSPSARDLSEGTSETS